MKGVVFTEFLEMIESRFGLATVDRIVEAAQLPDGGAYTSVGTYDHAELVRLASALSRDTGTPVPDLIKTFGHYLFGRFRATYPALFVGCDSAFAFLQSVEHHIHVEVRKLYPDAELPSFSYEEASADKLVMVYQSRRPFGDLAEGLIRGCIDHFHEAIVVARENLASAPMNRVRFTLTHSPGT